MTPLLLLAFFLAPQDRPPEKCSVSGTVVDWVTGNPLAKAEMMLEPLTGTQHIATSVTDAQGRFLLVDLNPGAYRLKGERNGYLETFYGALRPGRDGITITLHAGQALADLKHKLFPYAVISGTVRDSDGEPLVDAHVVLGRRSYTERGVNVEGVESVNTDDLGQYRFRVKPGRYYIGAEPKAGGPGKVDHSPVPSQPMEASVATMYPGVTDPALASPIEVAVGARVMGIDVTLRRSRVFRVAGYVLDPPRDVQFGVSLEHRGTLASMWDYKRHTAIRNPAGDFELRGVPPGLYTITSGSARVPVEVRSEDVRGIRVMVMPEAQVSGRIVIDGEDKPDLSSASLSFVFDGTRFWTVQLNSDLSFNAKVVPGNYHVLVTGLRTADKVYVKSITSGVTDILSEGLALPPAGSVSLEIVVATGGGTVEGAVVNAEEQPLPGATVVLAPEPKLRARPGRFRSATTDQYGRYALQSIPPGDYTLFAWEDVEPFAWSDPDFLRVYEKRGVTVRIQAKRQTAVKLRVADTPER